MTFSIVAWCPVTGEVGVAVCTKHFAVGAMVPHAASRVGAVATQAETNPLLGVRALAMMRAGIPAGQALIKALQASDAEFDLRQVHVVDSHGRAVAWTGRQCVDWAGHHTLDDVFASVAGNMLAGPQVLEAMATAFRRVSSPEALAKASPLPLAERLVAALAAGQAAGGDKRGQQSAAVIVYRDQAYTTVDIRVDDHRAPVAELQRLMQERRKSYAANFLDSRPCAPSPRPHRLRSKL